MASPCLLAELLLEDGVKLGDCNSIKVLLSKLNQFDQKRIEVMNLNCKLENLSYEKYTYRLNYDYQENYLGIKYHLEYLPCDHEGECTDNELCSCNKKKKPCRQ